MVSERDGKGGKGREKESAKNGTIQGKQSTGTRNRRRDSVKSDV